MMAIVLILTSGCVAYYPQTVDIPLIKKNVISELMRAIFSPHYPFRQIMILGKIKAKIINRELQEFMKLSRME